MGTARLTIQETTTLEHVLADLRLYHDDVQLRCFVLGQNGHGTVWGIYRQALMELDSRRSSLAGRTRDRDEAKAELAYAAVRARAWAFTAKARRDRELAKLDVAKYSESLTALSQQLENIARELRLVLRVAAQCKAELGSISDERRAELNREFWTFKFARQAKLALLGNGALDAGLIEALVHLPGDAYEKAMRMIGAPGVGAAMSEMRDGAVMVSDREELERVAESPILLTDTRQGVRLVEASGAD